ncbi:MAG: sigma-70 family RNA polymerase sigma factor [Bacteroidota bacterium]|nr:sigma-70 family RNA polymerase sigma factor [Bacteroidota bacterium]
MSLTDSYIIESLRNGDEKPLEYLYKQHYKMIANYIIKNSGSEEDARDIFQDAIIAFHKNVLKGRFELNGATIKTYLASICENIWRKKLREDRKMPFTDDESILESLAYIPDEDTERENQIRIVKECLSQATEHCKEILTNYFYSEMSMKKISEKMDLKNENTAKTEKYKCQKKLKICLNSKLNII